MTGPRHTSLTQFLIEERRRFPSATGGFNRLILDVATACKAIARAVLLVNLERDRSEPASEVASRLQAFAGESFLHFNRDNETLAALLSQELPAHRLDARGEHILVVDPLLGAANLDINAPLGSVFSVLRAPSPGRETKDEDFLQKGRNQVAAGYAFYGPSTMLVLSVGTGVHGFTLDPTFGDFMLTHPALEVPPETRELSINSTNSPFWEAPVKRYVGECVGGATGPRGQEFSMRWVDSVVADAHRLLLRGGVFLYPFDSRPSKADAQQRLLFGANPIGFLVEQAGGRATTGHHPLLDVQPTDTQQRVPVILGSRSEVERIERYHADPNTSISTRPLFNDVGLFRD